MTRHSLHMRICHMVEHNRGHNKWVYRQCWHSIIGCWSSIIRQWLIPPNPTADPTHILLLLSRVGAEEQLQDDESEAPDVAPRAQVGDGNVTLVDHRSHRHKLLSVGIE